MCEQALLAAAKQGQTEAFGTLCQPLAPKLIQTARRITRNREDAEDALQNAFLSAFIHIKNFDGRSSFSTWLTRIAINSALMTLRKKRSSREIPIASAELGANAVGWDVPDPSANPESCMRSARKKDFLGKPSASYDRPFDRLLSFSYESFPWRKQLDDGRLSGSRERTIVSREASTEGGTYAENKPLRAERSYVRLLVALP